MLSISSLVLKATGLMLLASTIVRGCDRTCDTLYFADYDDLADGTVLAGPNPYLGLRYGTYTVKDLRGNGFISGFTGNNALIAYNPILPTDPSSTAPVNRASIVTVPGQIDILDPESAFAGCVSVDKVTKQVKRAIRCEINVVGSGPHYYVVTDVWTFIPDHHKRSSLHLYNLGTNFNSINTIELHLKSFDPLPATREPAIIFDNFIYGGRLA